MSRYFIAVSDILHLFVYNFLFCHFFCSILNIFHPPHPFHLIQMLRHFPGQYQILIPGTPVFLQKFAYYSIFPICSFGPYEIRAPYYLVSMILHNQHIDITDNIKVFDAHLSNLGYQHQAIHTGPLIRRKSVYANDLV